jgi:hypothetical protein
MNDYLTKHAPAATTQAEFQKSFERAIGQLRRLAGIIPAIPCRYWTANTYYTTSASTSIII